MMQELRTRCPTPDNLSCIFCYVRFCLLLYYMYPQQHICMIHVLDTIHIFMIIHDPWFALRCTWWWREWGWRHVALALYTTWAGCRLDTLRPTSSLNRREPVAVMGSLISQVWKVLLIRCAASVRRIERGSLLMPCTAHSTHKPATPGCECNSLLTII